MNPDLDDQRNEVLRKVGRNVVLFQQFEVMLKFLVTHGRLSGYVRELEDIKEHRKTKVMKQTLGHVASQFIENTHGEYHDVDENLPDLLEKGVHISFSFRIQSDEKYYLKTKENLAKITQERNDLIHNFPLNFNLNTVEGLTGAENYLDAQREALLPEYKKVKQYLKALDEGRKEIATYIASGEFMKQWRISDLRDEYIVKLLGRIIEVAKREDGWTLVVHAGHLLHQNAPDQLKEVKKKYKCRTLKDLILKTEIFDVEDEPTPKGGRRAIYRFKDGWRLETHPVKEISN
ncbi:MAG: hypothetical protein ACYCYR_10325 [Desulfobulbaceae bacterium]